MNFERIHSVYFLGIGGIGMSALARYFLANDKVVGGYDLTSTPLTQELEELGMQIHYEDNVDLISEVFKQKETTLIVYTPAIPEGHAEFEFLKSKGFELHKRAKVLGELFNSKQGIAVAGTHGKTSVTTFASFLLQETGIGCSAFLGGISKNFKSNLVLSKSNNIVAEADEFDRSFLQLYPKTLLVTTVDVDHLDIYKDLNDINNTFSELLKQVDKDGTIILNEMVNLELPSGPNYYSYSLENADTDFYASNIQVVNGAYQFTFHTPKWQIDNLRLEVPGKTNIENAVAAMALCYVHGATAEALAISLPQLQGAVRRFDVQYKTDKKIYIDDYAHHPRELDAVIGSVREMYPGKKLTVVFQPHLYSRTNDFASEFAESLSKADELILLDIYPARENPLPGVTSELIFNQVSIKNKGRCSKVNLLHNIKELNIEVLLTVGAGDIDQYVGLIKQLLVHNEEN